MKFFIAIILALPFYSRAHDQKPKTIHERVEITKTVVKFRKALKNRVSIYGGSGPRSVTGAIISDRTARVDLDSDSVVGFGYSRRLGDRVSIEVIGLSNETYLGGFGWDF